MTVSISESMNGRLMPANDPDHHAERFDPDVLPSSATPCEPRCRHECGECRLGLGVHRECDPRCETATPAIGSIDVPLTVRSAEEVETSQAALVGISEWIDAGNAHRDPEAVTWGRLAKLAEEQGEVIEAFIGATGQNPRKGVTCSMEKVLEELLDVAITALGAFEHIDGHQGRALSELDGKIIRVAERAGVIPSRTIGPAAVQQALRLAATRCECCGSGCHCGCVLGCPVHKGADRTIRRFCTATRDDEYGDGMACFLSAEHEGQHAWTRYAALPEGHPNRVIGASVVHAVPHPISDLAGCCGRTAFEIPHGDRLTEDRAAVTCADRTIHLQKEKDA